MKEKVTIHDIARLLKVSPSTVSRALQDNPRISQATRKEIQGLARLKGYEPNNIASSLRQGKSSTVGVVVPRINRHFFSNIIGGMEDILNNAGYNLVICQSSENFQTEVSNLKSLIKLRVDAIFISLSASTTDNSHLKELIKRGNRVFLFDRTDENIKSPQVMVDDFRGAYDLVSHMIDQGFRKIVHFAGPSNIKVYRDRKMGFISAMEDKGLKVSSDMIIPDIITKETGYEAMMNLSRNNIPEAIFSASDFSALGALIASRDLNIKIPTEMGIAGFANEPFTEFVQPGITSVDQKARLMGKKLAELFLQGEQPDENHIEVITPELIIRNSTLINKK